MPRLVTTPFLLMWNPLIIMWMHVEFLASSRSCFGPFFLLLLATRIVTRNSYNKVLLEFRSCLEFLQQLSTIMFFDHDLYAEFLRLVEVHHSFITSNFFHMSHLLMLGSKEYEHLQPNHTFQI